MMRSLLFVCIAVLLLWGNVAEKEIDSPKADELDIETQRATWQRELASRLRLEDQLPTNTKYWEQKVKYMELAIQKLNKKIPQMRRKYAKAKAENRTLATKLELSNSKLYDPNLELKRAEKQPVNCKDIDKKSASDDQWISNKPNQEEKNSRENLPTIVGRYNTNGYIRLLKNWRMSIDRELNMVTNSLWKKVPGRKRRIHAKYFTSEN